MQPPSTRCWGAHHGPGWLAEGDIYMWIGLGGNGGAWLERSSEPYTKAFKPEAVIEGGELLIYWGRLHAILTPPWWKPKRA